MLVYEIRIRIRLAKSTRLLTIDCIQAFFLHLQADCSKEIGGEVELKTVLINVEVI